MSNEANTVEKFRAPLATAIDSAGSEIEALAGSSIRIEYHQIEITAVGQNYQEGSKVITPPAGWRQVSVSVANWSLHYGHDIYKTAQLAHAAAGAGVKLNGNTLAVSAYGLFREAVSAPNRKWKANLTVQVIFIN